MTDSNQIIQKIQHVILSAAQFRDEQFRLVLEGLVKKGGKDAELLLVSYITSKKVPTPARINIIRATGYIQNALYLVPLKKVIDSEPDINLKKAAILALSKYNNRKAMTILSNALQNIKNPYLMKTINEQISLIKQNNPILALLPRFLKGNSDIKAHTVALGILKKILKPEDTTFFLNYLKADDPMVENGSFEILCCTGNTLVRDAVFEYFHRNAAEMECLGQPKCDELLQLAKNLAHYIKRFPDLLEPQFPQLKTILSSAGDKRVRKALISLFCKSQNSAVFDFIKEVYEEDAELKDTIIDAAAGNSYAVDFLVEKYQSGAQDMKENVVKSLLNSTRGFQYFINHFFDFEAAHQEMIVRNLPHSDHPDLVALIGNILNSGDQSLKRYILHTIRRNHLYSFKDALFDPEKEKGYFAMEDDYLDTIFGVFPTDASKKLIRKIAEEDLPVNDVKKYLELILTEAHSELVLTLNDPNDTARMRSLVNRFIHLNNIELNLKFLSMIELFKTFDFQTYRNLLDAVTLYVQIRSEDENYSEEEKSAVRRARESLNSLNNDIKNINVIEKNLKMALMKSKPDILSIRRIIASNGIALAFKAEPLIGLFVEHFNTLEGGHLASWREFFKEFPLIAMMVREERINAEQTQRTDSDPLEPLHEKLRIVINFREKELNFLFKDQFREVIPHFKVTLDDMNLSQTDILLCDSDTLKEYIDQKKLITSRIFVLLNDRSEFNTFKNYNPRTFLRPVSSYRTLRLILQELYFMRS
jgi:hypothetical protein